MLFDSVPSTNRLPNRMLTLTGSHYVRVIEHCANIASLIWVWSEPPASTRPNVENMLDTRGFNSRRIIRRETFDRPPPSINDATAIQVNFRTRCVHTCNSSQLLEPLIHALKSRHMYNNSDWASAKAVYLNTRRSHWSPDPEGKET